MKGFDYICKAINYILSDRTVNVCNIYDFVASDYGTKPQSVERAIRHAISKMDKDSEAWEKYLGIKDTKNSAVLYTMAIKLQED